MLLSRFLLLLICLFFSSCKSPKQVIRIAGSSTVLPVIEKAATAYTKLHPHISIQINTGGSGIGVNQIALNKIDIGMISRDISQEEINAFPQVDFKTIIVGKDAVVPVVSNEIYEQGLTEISLTTIGQIYQGYIKNWEELGINNSEILVIDKEASRGTRQVFMQAILGDKDARAQGAGLVLGHNNEVQTAIAQSDQAIGMLSFAWLNQEVKALAIKDEQGKVTHANLETIKQGDFPIIRSLGLLIDHNKPVRPEVADFLEYLLSTAGQSIVSELQYIPVNA